MLYFSFTAAAVDRIYLTTHYDLRHYFTMADELFIMHKARALLQAIRI